MDDLISRQTVIDIVTATTKEYYGINPVAVIEKLQAVPSVGSCNECRQRWDALEDDGK